MEEGYDYEFLKAHKLLSRATREELGFPILRPDQSVYLIPNKYAVKGKGRWCMRCGQQFWVNHREGHAHTSSSPCFVHPLRAGPEGLHACCGGPKGSHGCAKESDFHLDYKRTSVKAYYARAHPKPCTRPPRVIALSTEMSLTGRGLEPTRLVLVDFATGDVIRDLYLRPTVEVIDYISSKSSVTPAHLQNVTLELSDIKVFLSTLIGPEDILLGHSLEVKLASLEFVHNHVVDTSFLYTKKGPDKRPSLLTLVRNCLPQTHVSEGKMDPIDACRYVCKLVKRIIPPSPYTPVEP